MIGTRVTNGFSWSASLNETRNDTRIASRSDVIKGTTVSFTATGTIADSGNGMGAVKIGDRLEVRGSASNSRRWRPSAAAAGGLTVVPAQIATIAATPAIQLIRR